jgi:signal transduction histidine kinase
LGEVTTPPESVWSGSEPGQIDSIRKLWTSGVALGCSIDRTIDESGIKLPWKGLDWSIMLQGALWTMAARSPGKFRNWFESADESVRLGIEIEILGVSADVWSQWILGRTGLNKVARAIWMIKADPSSCPRSIASHDESTFLADIVRKGHSIAVATRYGLDQSFSAEFEANDPRIALTEAMVRSVLARYRLEAPDDAALVRRSLALIRISERASRAEARTVQTEGLLKSIDTDIRRLVGTQEFVGVASDSETTVLPASESPFLTESRTTSGDTSASPQSIEFRWNQFRSTLWNRFHQWEDWAKEVGRRRAASDLQAQASRFESLAEFAAGAGHELNNPLAVIQGRAQLLLARATDDQTRSSLKAIVDQTLRAHRMLRDLIFIARPGEPRPRLFRPAETLRGIVREFKAESGRRNLQIQLRVPSEITSLDLDRLDPDSYRHLATALVRNAIEASPEGGMVTISLKHDQNGLTLQVEDQGRGFDSNEALHLFDPFYCGRRAGRGLGLGLPRVARIVAQMNGKIRFRSHPGQGTAFEVIVPAPPARSVSLSHSA